jgi:hypothetical protein
LAFAEKGFSLAPWAPITAGLLAGLLVKSGDGARAAELIDRLGDGRASGAPVAFAIFHLLGGEVEKAAEWTERALEQKAPVRVYGAADATLEAPVELLQPMAKTGKDDEFTRGGVMVRSGCFVHDGCVQPGIENTRHA